MVTEHLQYPVHFCFPLSQQKTELLLIFNRLRSPFSSLHLLASCILFHSLRHTAAILAIKAGADLYEVQQMLGHTDVKTTTIYLRAIEEEVRINNRAVQTIDDVLSNGVFGLNTTKK